MKPDWYKLFGESPHVRISDKGRQFINNKNYRTMNTEQQLKDLLLIVPDGLSPQSAFEQGYTKGLNASQFLKDADKVKQNYGVQDEKELSKDRCLYEAAKKVVAYFDNKSNNKLWANMPIEELKAALASHETEPPGGEEGLFIKKGIRLNSGIDSDFKIECDALTNSDIDCIAYLISKHIKFSEVHGVPKGGLRLANSLEQYRTNNPLLPILICDDVLTTGESMRRFAAGIPNTIGAVIFARGECPSWITPLFQMF